MQLCPQQRFSAHAARAAGLMSWKCWGATDWKTLLHQGDMRRPQRVPFGDHKWPVIYNIEFDHRHDIERANQVTMISWKFWKVHVHPRFIWATVSLHRISKPNIYACRNQLCISSSLSRHSGGHYLCTLAHPTPANPRTCFEPLAEGNTGKYPQNWLSWPLFPVAETQLSAFHSAETVGNNHDRRACCGSPLIIFNTPSEPNSYCNWEWEKNTYKIISGNYT